MDRLEVTVSTKPHSCFQSSGSRQEGQISFGKGREAADFICAIFGPLEIPKEDLKD